MKKPRKQAKAASKEAVPSKRTKGTLTRARVPRIDGEPGKPNDVSWHETFIKALGTTANVAAACRAVRISRNTAYEHKTKFQSFRQEWEEAEALALDGLYTVGLDHATNGTERAVFQGGKKVGTVLEYDHRLLEWLLERKRPAEFGAKQKLELSGKITMTDEEITAASAQTHESLLLTMAGGLKGGQSS